MYICSVYVLINNRTEEVITFKYNRKDVENNSLGTLLKKFEKLNTNKELIKKIKSLIKQRNHVAHQGFLLTYEEQQDDKFLSEQIESIELIVKSSKECLDLLLVELKKVDRA